MCIIKQVALSPHSKIMQLSELEQQLSEYPASEQPEAIIRAIENDQSLAREVLETPELRERNLSSQPFLVAHGIVAEFPELAREALRDPAIAMLGENKERTVGEVGIIKHAEVAQTVMEDINLARQTWTSTNSTLAHVASRFHLSAAQQILEQEELAAIYGEDNKTVAHFAVRAHNEMARAILEHPNIAKLREKIDRQATVAHMAVNYHLDVAREVLNYPEIAALEDGQGLTVGAWVMQDPDIAEATLDEEELYHLPASSDHLLLHQVVRLHENLALEILQKPELYSLTGAGGESVLAQAVKGHTTVARRVLRSPELSDLTDKQGHSVTHVALQEHKNIRHQAWEQALEGEGRFWNALAEACPQWLIQQLEQHPEQLNPDNIYPLLTHSTQAVRETAMRISQQWEQEPLESPQLSSRTPEQR